MTLEHGHMSNDLDPHMSTWTRAHMSIDTRAVTHEQRHMSRLEGDTWALKNDTLALLNHCAQVVPECAHVSILWPLTRSLVMCQCSRWHVSTLVTVLTCFFYDVMLMFTCTLVDTHEWITHVLFVEMLTSKYISWINREIIMLITLSKCHDVNYT